MNRRVEFDDGPLSWVKGEIDLSMQRGLQALQAFAAGDAAQIKASQAHLHQAHGALEIVGLDGVTRVSAELEGLLTDIGGGACQDPVAALAIAERAFASITGYLDALMAGASDQALRLLPLYRDLRAMRAGAAVGADAVEAVDLYFPELSFRPPWRDKAPVQLHPEESAKYFRDQRTRYQRGFLLWLKADVAGAAEMRAAVEAIEQTQSGAAERAFWWALIACFDALERDAVPQDIEAHGLNLRRLCNRIDAQIKRLAEGTSNVDMRLLREILYCVALARPDSDVIRLVQETCQLAKTIPGPEGVPAPPELPGLKPAREILAQTKEAWNRYASEPGGSGDNLSAFGVVAHTLAEQAARLGNADLVALCGRIASVGASLGAEPGRMSEVVALETATALLLVENALESLATDAGSLGDAFGEQSRVLCNRLEAAVAGSLLRTAPDIPLLGEMSRQAQERLVVEQVVAEMQANLRSVEQLLDQFFRDPSQRETLAPVGASLHQMTGALEILGETRARDLLAITEAAIARFAQPDYTPQQEDFEYVARTLSGLGFYIAALGRGEQLDINEILRPLPAAEPSVMPPAVPTPAGGEAAPTGLDTPVVAAPATVQEQHRTRPAVVIVDKVDAELLGIYLEEAEEVLGNIAAHLDRLRGNNADLDAFITIRRGFHTLKGSGRMVGLNVLGEAAWTVEQALNWRLQEEHPVTAAVLDLVDQAHRYFVDSVEKLKNGGLAEDASALAQLAGAVRSGKAPALPLMPAVSDVAPDASLPVAPAEEAAQPVPETQAAEPPPQLPEGLLEGAIAAAAKAAAAAPEPPPDTVAEPAGQVVPETENVVRLGDAAISTTVFTIFSGEAHALLGVLLAEHETLKQHGIVTDEMLRAVHTLAGIAGSVQLYDLSELGHAFEHALDQLSRDTLSEDELQLVGETIEAIQVMVTSAIDLEVAPPVFALVARLEAAAQPRANVYHADGDAILPEEEGALAREEDTAASAVVAVARVEAAAVITPSPEPSPEPSAVAAPIAVAGGAARREQRLEDELDAQLLPLFLEEAAEIVPDVGESLRRWRGMAADAGANKAAFAEIGHAMERRLHTLKGSARMAGAMALGEVAHHMETRIEVALAASNVVPGLFDELDNAFDRIGQLLDQLARPVAEVSGAVAAAAVATDESAAINVLRARADAIDQMVNQTGEISIARSRIEGELRLLKTAMRELTDNVTRLRSQLREVEIQAESQMQAAVRAVDGQYREGFDPLEFDRFTRFQEVTRMMAESVNDVQSVHQNMLRAMEGTDTALAVQARLNRELQKDLMRVRMVAFGTLSERLHRIVRQTAKDAGKRANVDIRGSGVELDRAVLERITAPIEHVLRNAITHGIESPEQRQALGKSAIGDIRIEVSQEGNEMRLAIADDGAGLDLDRIRAKAIQLGLLAEGAVISEAELADFVFFPGFSTARELTQAAGRGVGMDVVRNEVAALSGRAELSSERGKGMRIIIFLPLTLAVTQVVLVRATGRLFAIPSVMVEQVTQYRPEPLAALYSARQVEWRGRRYALHYLPQLLGDRQATAEQKRFAAVIFVRSGASAIAMHVDEIVGGSQEVVVKAIGPQLQRVTGMAGATIIGSGDIVLIINPVSLAISATAAAAAEPAASSAGHGAAIAPPVFAPLPAALKLVMVVDDSLTVRKITSRLLERQGYSVVLARDGVEALELLQEDLPDVMLVDIEMPRMDGFDLTRNVRADPRLAKVPIIMISSRTADKHRNYAGEIGVNAFLGKPYQEEELLARIEECMTGKTAV